MSLSNAPNGRMLMNHNGILTSNPRSTGQSLKQCWQLVTTVGHLSRWDLTFCNEKGREAKDWKSSIQERSKEVDLQFDASQRQLPANSQTTSNMVQTQDERDPSSFLQAHSRLPYVPRRKPRCTSSARHHTAIYLRAAKSGRRKRGRFKYEKVVLEQASGRKDAKSM